MATLFPSLRRCAAALLLAATMARGAVDISDVQVTNVGTTTFTVIWRTSEVSTAGLDVFSDNAGTSPVTSALGLDYYPMAKGDPAIVDDASARADRRALEILSTSRRVVAVQVTGAVPATTYYVRPRTFGSGGADNGSAVVPLKAVTTATFTSMPADGRLVRVRFPNFTAEGMIAVVQGPSGATMLSSIIGDSTTSDAALFPLANLLEAATGTNALYNAPQSIVVRVIGSGAPTGTFTKSVPFGATFNVAKYETFDADVSSPNPFFTTQPLDRTAQEGTNTTLTVVATGTPAPTYRWQRKPAGGSTWSDLAANATYTNVGTATLGINGLTLAMAGDQFRCVAANGVPPDATSDVATLTVLSVVLPPSITTQPASFAATPGQTATFSVVAAGTPAPAVKWQRKTAAGSTWTDLLNGPVYSGVATSTLTVAGSTLDMSGDQFRAVASNGSVPDATSNAATLTVSAAPTAPLFATQPQSTTVAPGVAATFSVAVTGSPVPTLKWQYQPAAGGGWTNLTGNATYAGVTSTVLTVNGPTVGMSGDQFRAVAANGVNPDATSTVATLTVSATGVAPAITTQPQSVIASTGTGAVFSVVATGTPTPTYQWRKGGNPIAGATNPTLSFAAVTTADAGIYSVVVTNAVSAVTSSDATLTVNLTSALRAFALRSRTGPGAAMLSGVFQVEGAASKSVLVRTLGPGLVQPPYITLVDPQLQITARDGTPVAFNGNWSTAANAATVVTTTASLGALPLVNGSADAAVLSSFAPGVYGFRASAADNAAGFVGFELYEADIVPRIVYLAARGYVGPGTDAQVAGLVVAGTGPRTFLIRAIGPSLGIPGALADPKLEVYQGATKLAENDNWAGTTQTVATQVGAPVLDLASKDAALSVTLTPGAYTVNVSGVGGASGLALMEVYEVDADRSAVVAPVIVSQPADVTAVTGTTAVFKVVAAGKPAATYQWRKDGLALSGETNAVLSIANVQRPGHAGSYDVVVNAAGSTAITSSPALLTILPAEITALAPASAVAGGAGFALTVTGSGFTGTSVVRWNGAARPTTFVNGTTLTAAIPAGDIAATGSIQAALVTVENPTADYSNSRVFAVRPSGVAAAALQGEVVRPGGSVTVTTAPAVAGDAGVTATLDNNTAGSATAALAVANYPDNPTAVPYFNAGGRFSDLQVSGADATDRVTAHFYYPSTVGGGAESDLALLYFDKIGANWKQVLSSGGGGPLRSATDNLDGTTSGGRFSVVFDHTSTPKLTELTGTVFTVSVKDSVAPAIALVTASPNVLGTPDRSMVPVTLTVSASDLLDPTPRTRILSVTSSEPESGTEAGDLSPDWEITGDTTLKLRAERTAAGSGRTYTITVEVRDAAGNAATKTTTVSVPPPVAGPADVTAQLQVTGSGFTLNRSTLRFAQTITIRNIGSQPITGPVSLVFNQISPNAILYGPTGFTSALTPAGSPYVNLNVGADGVLSVGETITLNVEFNNLSNQSINYTWRAYAGSGSR